MEAPLIDPKYEPMLRAAVITVLVFGLYALFRPSSKFSRDALDLRIYKPHRNWWYLCYVGLIGFTGFFIYLAAGVPNPDLETILFIFSLWAVFAAMGLLGLQKLRSSFIEVLEDELYTKYGRKENRIPYNQIIDAYYHYGYLHIVLQEKNRHGMHKEKRIPAIFANQGALLENIRQRATGASVHILS